MHTFTRKHSDPVLIPIQTLPVLARALILIRLLFEITSIAFLAVTVCIRHKWRDANPNQQVVPAITAASLATAADILLVIFMVHLHNLVIVAHVVDVAAFAASCVGCLTLYRANYSLVNGSYAPAEWDRAERNALVIGLVVLVQRIMSFIVSALWRRAVRRAVLGMITVAEERELGTDLESVEGIETEKV